MTRPLIWLFHLSQWRANYFHLKDEGKNVYRWDLNAGPFLTRGGYFTIRAVVTAPLLAWQKINERQFFFSMTVEKKLLVRSTEIQINFFFGEKPEFQSFGISEKEKSRFCEIVLLRIFLAEWPNDRLVPGRSVVRTLDSHLLFMFYQLVQNGFDQLLSFLHWPRTLSSAVVIKLSEIEFENSGMPRIEPGTAGWEERTLPLCYAVPQDLYTL